MRQVEQANHLVPDAATTLQEPVVAHQGAAVHHVQKESRRPERQRFIAIPIFGPHPHAAIAQRALFQK